MKPAILYEDDYIVAFNKPAGLVCHPTLDPGREDLLGIVKVDYKDLHLLHRLDKDTTGAILAAKGRRSAAIFTPLFKDHQIFKFYLAIVQGVPAFDSKNIFTYLAPVKGLKNQYMSVRSGGKRAETKFKLLSSGADSALIEASPLTGRSHQIRVHLAETGHPIMGDRKYGAFFRYDVKRPMLHSSSLSFTHPVTNKKISILAPITADFSSLLENLKITNR